MSTQKKICFAFLGIHMQKSTFVPHILRGLLWLQIPLFSVFLYLTSHAVCTVEASTFLKAGRSNLSCQYFP